MTKLIAVLVVSMSLTACGPAATDQQLGIMQDSVAVLEQEIVSNRKDLVVVTDPVQRAKLEAAINTQLKQVRILKVALDKAENMADAKWTTGEAVIGMIGTFFPPALLALPWIRTLRRQRTAIFDSIKAGGGPKDPDAAKLSLFKQPAARKAFVKWKNGSGA